MSQTVDVLKSCLTPAEIESVMRRSNLAATWMVISNWSVIAGCFAAFAVWPNPFTALLGIVVLGARQLGLAVLNHDCAHYVMFSKRRVNELVGHWLCGGPIHLSLYAYRTYHLKHHRFAGTREDPDLALALSYPTSRLSMRRKLLRDATGRTGLKDIRNRLSRPGLERHLPFVASHAAMLGVLALFGAAWAYLLWWAAYLTVYQLVTRLRFMGEHGVAVDRLSSDPRENTCTTLVSWWERALIAPNFVNYHLEHHLTAAVPCYNLPRLHRLLSERGYFEGIACLSRGYADVVRKAIRPSEPVAAAA